MTQLDQAPEAVLDHSPFVIKTEKERFLKDWCHHLYAGLPTAHFRMGERSHDRYCVALRPRR